MAKTDSDIIRSLVSAVSEPVFIVIPNRELEDEQLVKLFEMLEEVLTKVETKIECEFDVMVESAIYFGGYTEMADVITEDKYMAEQELDQSEQEGTENDVQDYPGGDIEEAVEGP